MRNIRRKNLIWTASIVLIAVTFLWADSEASPTPSRHHYITKRTRNFYQDKGYGDGSMKHFFIMLKIVLKIFGKHWLLVLILLIIHHIYWSVDLNVYYYYKMKKYRQELRLKISNECYGKRWSKIIIKTGNFCEIFCFLILAPLFLIHFPATAVPRCMFVTNSIYWTSMFWTGIFTVVILNK